MKYIIVPTVISIFLLSGCSKSTSEVSPALADSPLPVRTISATNGAFERSITVQGSLESVDSAIASARVPGPLLRVPVDIGDAVTAGKTVLFEVDPATVSNQVIIAREAAATARAQVAVAEANLAKAGAVARKAARDAERFDRLHENGSVSDNEWERAATQRESAAADEAVAAASLLLARQQVSQAEAQLSIAERQLSDATVLAPCDGTVQARLKEPGEMVGAGTPVVKINGTDRLKALAFLPAQYFSEVVPGKTEIEITAGTETSSTSGRPDSVSTTVAAKTPAIDPKLRVFEIKALVSGGGGAVPGAMASIKVVLEKKNGVSVPLEAVLLRAAGTVVFVASSDGVAREMPVTVGLRDNGRAEILDGIEAGTPVIVQGQTQLYDGRKIEVR